jgi:hypothetical protein
MRIRADLEQSYVVFTDSRGVEINYVHLDEVKEIRAALRWLIHMGEKNWMSKELFVRVFALLLYGLEMATSEQKKGRGHE